MDSERIFRDLKTETIQRNYSIQTYNSYKASLRIFCDYFKNKDHPININSKDDLPYGATMLYLLSESHLSIHTFVDEGKITIDLFTCGLGVEDGNIKSIIKDYFGVNFLNIDAYYFTRGN